MEPIRRNAVFYLAAIVFFTLLALLTAQYVHREAAVSARGSAPLVYIDPGHGGEDGGAVSVSGAKESALNLSVSLRVRDLLRFCGVRTAMTREGDYALYEEGSATFSQKKTSDLRRRVALLREHPDAILLSIHQNKFPEAKYRGAQAFYKNTPDSALLAEAIQDSLRHGIDPRNHRKPKPAEGIYLLEKIDNPAVLLECGFLSNPEEEALLRTDAYQKKLVCAVCAGLINGIGRETLL